MTTDRTTARIVGVLFIIATAFLFIGQAVYGPFLDTPDYLDLAWPHRAAAAAGMLLEFACVVAIPLIAVFMYPVLRRMSPQLALGYVVFRSLEAALFVLVEINTLSLIDISRRYLAGGGADPVYLAEAGATIQAWNEWAFSLYVIVFTLGALMLYAALWRPRLVPRFISGWGFLAASLLLAGMVLYMVGISLGLGEGAFQAVFAAPIAVNEMVLALWLIGKGFREAEGA